MGRNKKVKINIFNQTHKTSINKLKSFIRKAATGTLNIKKSKFEEINIIFVDDNEIKRINKNFLSKNRATDVISFNYLKHNPPLNQADIFISADTAYKNSKIYSLSFISEIIILVIHGILHALDYNDKTVNQRKKMSELTLKILKKITI